MSRRRAKRNKKQEATAKRNADANARAPVDAGGYTIQHTSDARLLERAIKQGWNIPDAVFSAAPEAMAQLMDSKEQSPRTRIAAVKALTVMHGQNQQAGEPAASPSAVNVNVAVGVQMTLVDKSDADLERFIAETAEAGGADGVGAATAGVDPLPGGILSALANGSTNGFSANGRH